MPREKRVRVSPKDEHLRNVRTVFLFGAGTSAHMKLCESDDAPCVPTDASFFEVVNDDLLKRWCTDSNILEIAENARERVFRALRDAGISEEQLNTHHGNEHPELGLEEVFCRLDMLRMLGQFIPTPPAGNRWRHPVDALRDLIAIVMASGGPANNETGYTGFARRLLANHQTRSVNTYAVLSLNYELGLECTIKTRFEEDSSTFPETRENAKRYNVDSVGMHDLVHYDLPHRQPPLSTTEVVPMLKLHGSCNWGFCPECENVAHIPIELPSARGNIQILVKKLFGHPDDRQACEWHSADYPLLPKYLPHIIPPTWNKWMGDYTLRHIWRQAYSVLANCKKLFVVGTSMPDTDIHLRHMIQMAFSRNPLEPQVYVVNPVGVDEEKPAGENQESRQEYMRRVDTALGRLVPEKNYLWARFEGSDTLDWLFDRIDVGEQ